MLKSDMTFRRALQEILPPEQPSNIPIQTAFANHSPFKSSSFPNDHTKPQMQPNNTTAKSLTKVTHEQPSTTATGPTCSSPADTSDDWLVCDETLSEEDLHPTNFSFLHRQYDMYCGTAHNTQLCTNFCPTSESSSTLHSLLYSESLEDCFSNAFKGWTRQDPFDANLSLHPHMRDTVMSWMRDVCSEEDVEEGTFHLSCCYLDRMVASSFQLVNKSNLQRYASVCMLMASKFKQADILLPSLLHQYTDQSVSSSDLRESERTALELLQWDLHILNPHIFVSPLLSLLPPLDPYLAASLRRETINFIDTSIFSLALTSSPPSLVACCSLVKAFNHHTPSSFHQAILHQVMSLVKVESDAYNTCMNDLEEVLSLHLEAYTPPHDLQSQPPFLKPDFLGVKLDNQENTLNTPKTSPIPPLDLTTPPDVKDISMD